MDPNNKYQDLYVACDKSASYPTNLLRSKSLGYALKSYRGRLDAQAQKLFETDEEFEDAGVKMCEAYDDSDFTPLTKYSKVSELEAHLLRRERKDPECRYVFVTADSSRSPLDCSKDVFTYISTFFQVMPKFLDLVCTFGKQSTQKDFHYTAFSEESFLNTELARNNSIPRLGRSGLEIRMCYNLWSVEASERPGPWSIRQTAVYHSFDVLEGRALWINIKGNEEIRDRITESLSPPSEVQKGFLETRSRSFSAALRSHMLIFEWSAENWRGLIGHLDNQLQGLLKKARNVPLSTVEARLDVDLNVLMDQLDDQNTPDPAFPVTPSRVNSTLVKAPTRKHTSNSQQFSISRVMTGISRVSTGIETLQQASQPTSPSIRSPTSPIIGRAAQNITWNQKNDKGVFDIAPSQLLQEFKVSGLQDLTNIGAKLHEASLVMKLNADIILQVVEYYEYLVSQDSIPEDLKKACARDLQYFAKHARGIVRDMMMEQYRIETLMTMLEDGKSLFDSILQFRNMEINKLFVANAHQSSKKMEIMTEEMHQSTKRMEEMTACTKILAEKTEKQTTSMHIVTLVTLVFLPGTFVATFFSSGAFQWDQNNPESSQMPYWKPGFFALFAEICFPMTGGIILLWYLSYEWARWRREREEQKSSSGLGDLERQQFADQKVEVTNGGA